MYFSKALGVVLCVDLVPLLLLLLLLRLLTSCDMHVVALTVYTSRMHILKAFEKVLNSITLLKNEFLLI